VHQPNANVRKFNTKHNRIKFTIYDQNHFAGYFMSVTIGIAKYRFAKQPQIMNTTKYLTDEELRSLFEKLDKYHYSEINAKCVLARKQAEQLQELEVHQITSQYVALCLRLIAEVEHYVSFKKERLLPYVRSLFEKNAAGHDCRNCTGTGNCGMEHEMQLLELAQSLKKLNDIIYRLQMTALPLYSETIHKDAYRILRNNMGALEIQLAELSILEELHLAPKVKEAQKNINVRI
jgi:hypothetical protein